MPLYTPENISLYLAKDPKNLSQILQEKQLDTTYLVGGLGKIEHQIVSALVDIDVLPLQMLTRPSSTSLSENDFLSDLDLWEIDIENLMYSTQAYYIERLQQCILHFNSNNYVENISNVLKTDI